MKSQKICIKQNEISTGLDFISEGLDSLKIEKKEKIHSLLIAEETINKLIMNSSDENDEITIIVQKKLRSIVVSISLKGEQFELIGNSEIGDILDSENDDADNEEDKIRDILLNANKEQLRYKNRKGVNKVIITVRKVKCAMVVYTMAALVAAIVLGFILKMILPQAACNALDSNILTPVNTMFLNALKMIVAPVVFFSIVTCISQFGDLKEVGRVGGKIMGIYMMTTVFAIAVGAAAFFLIKPGNSSLASQLVTTTDVVSASQTTVSIKNTIINIIPNNFLKPFIESDMLQIIFLALLTGIAMGQIGIHAKTLKSLFDACNELFLKITTILVKFIPVATFCSIMTVVLKTGVDAMVSLLAMIGTYLFGTVIMMVVYSLLIVIFARISPFPFLKKYMPTMLQVFGIGSSNAAIMLNMDACDKKLGVSKKIYTLSIPLGATVNMDGTCIYLVVMGLALAKVFGVDISGGMLFSMFFSVLVLSVGAPAVPGAGLVCLSVLLTQINVPLAGVGLIMGVDSILGMVRTAGNCLGDVAAAVVVAKSEKALDMETYRSK